MCADFQLRCVEQLRFSGEEVNGQCHSDTTWLNEHTMMHFHFSRKCVDGIWNSIAGPNSQTILRRHFQT